MSMVSVFNYYHLPSTSKQLVNLLYQIQQGKFGKKVEYYRAYFQDGREVAFDESKRRIPWFSVAGNFILENGRKKMVSYSGYALLEIPYIHKKDREGVRLLLEENEHVMTCFENTLGTGLCFIVPTGCEAQYHTEAFKLIRSYFQTLLGVNTISKDGADIAHLCMMSYDGKMLIRLDARPLIASALEHS